MYRTGLDTYIHTWIEFEQYNLVLNQIGQAVKYSTVFQNMNHKQIRFTVRFTFAHVLHLYSI